MVTNIRRVLNLANKEIKKNEPPTLNKCNAGFIAKIKLYSCKKILGKMKISSSKSRTALILDVATHLKEIRN